MPSLFASRVPDTQHALQRDAGCLDLVSLSYLSWVYSLIPEDGLAELPQPCACAARKMAAGSVEGET